MPGAASLPLVANNDRDGLSLAMRGVPMLEAETARIVRIENTLDLGEIWISEAMVADAEAHPEMEIISEPFEIGFDADDQMESFHPPQEMAAG